MHTRSTTSLAEEAKEFSKNEKNKREYQLIINEYKKVINSKPSNFYERSLVCYYNEQIARIRRDLSEAEYRIAKEALADYVKIKSCYDNLIEEKETEMKKETKKDTEYFTTDKNNTKYYNAPTWPATKEDANVNRYNVNVNRYNLAVVLYKIGLIMEDQDNTTNFHNSGLSSETTEHQNMFKDAIEKIKEIDNEDLKVFNLLSVIYLALNDGLESNFYADRVVRIRPKSEDTDFEFYLWGLFNKGINLYKQNKYLEAHQCFYEYYKYKSDDPSVTALLGDTYISLKDFQEAYTYYEKTYQLRKAQYSVDDAYSLNGMAFCNLLSAYTFQEEAIRKAELSLKSLQMTDLEDMDKDIPFDTIDDYTIDGKQLMVEALTIIGTTYLEQDNSEGALPFVRKAREINEHYDLGFIGPHFLEGIILMENNKMKEAKKDFEKITKYKPGYAESYAALGVCHYNLGNNDQSAASLKEAIRIKPELASAHITLYKIEKQKNVNLDLGKFWTKSWLRIFALGIIIFVAFLTFLHSIYYPDIQQVTVESLNYTTQQGQVAETNTQTKNPNLGQLRLAIIIGLIILILWPSIKTIKVGASSIEVEKLSYVEGREQIYFSWIPYDQIIFRGVGQTNQ